MELERYPAMEPHKKYNIDRASTELYGDKQSNNDADNSENKEDTENDGNGSVPAIEGKLLEKCHFVLCVLIINRGRNKRKD